MYCSDIRDSKNKKVKLQKDGKNGFNNSPKPNFKAKGSATKMTSHRRGRV